jgi:predicted porin
MKLKTSAIAMAVAGTLATPMAAQADVYASVRIGVENLDTGGVSDMRTRSFGSRFGIRSETDLGNGCR